MFNIGSTVQLSEESLQFYFERGGEVWADLADELCGVPLEVIDMFCDSETDEPLYIVRTQWGKEHSFYLSELEPFEDEAISHWQSSRGYSEACGVWN